MVLFNFAAWDMSLSYHFEKMVRVWVYTLEKLFESEETQINGFVVICNLRQLSVLQTKSLRTAMLTKAQQVFQVRGVIIICRDMVLNGFISRTSKKFMAWS